MWCLRGSCTNRVSSDTLEKQMTPLFSTYQICDSESPSNRDLISKSLAFSPDIVCSLSPTACLNRVSNLA